MARQCVVNPRYLEFIHFHFKTQDMYIKGVENKPCNLKKRLKRCAMRQWASSHTSLGVSQITLRCKKCVKMLLKNTHGYCNMSLIDLW